ncbi:MAG: type II toxin-antitoxin system Phd/YefM family antitoxin [Bryobacteraceae bacterium]|nr:type II toxin-antitoxin system Phd/YefM family antitoxin [Bryobacteraceae bacterium]
MLHIGKDIHSLSDFKRQTSEMLGHLRSTGRPVVLTLNGRAEVVVQDASAYQELLDYVIRLEALAGVRRELTPVLQAEAD